MANRPVLIADDNLTIQRMASEMLSGAGLEVVTVANGMAAIKKLADVKPLVVLADADMPGKDGYEVCDFVKKQPDLHYVRVLLAVSDMDPFDPVRGAEARVDGVVKKPFDRENLVSAIVKSLGEAEALCPPPPQKEPDLPNPWAWQPEDLADAPDGEPLLPDPLDQADLAGTFSASPVASGAHQDFPVEFAESAGPPIVDWTPAPFRQPAEVHLEPPTPVSGCYFNEHPAAAIPGIMPGSAERQAHPAQSPASASEPSATVVAAQHSPEPAPEPVSESASSIDPSLVAAVVRSVVARMAPPALSKECLRDLEQELTREIVREMTSKSPGQVDSPARN